MSECTTTSSRRPTRRRAVRLARTVAAPLLVAALVTAGSPGWGLYTIKQGDTLSDIAARYHTTVAKLVEVNGLPGNGNLIIAGRALKVPGAAAGTGGGSGPRHHTVVRGDTLSGIASRYGVAQAAIARANHLPSSNIVMLGATLVIPGGGSRSSGGSTSSGGNTFAGRTYSSAVVSAADRTRAQLARRHLPSQAGMRDIIVAKARANGVDPALALAVSYQESGWNMRAVSVASPSDNATTGVVLLKILTRAASSERQAVAAYYQGLRSVRENGMFADTRHYVANVMALKARFE
jgi:LysM repeat protein